MNIVVLDGHTLNPGDNPWSALEQLGHLTVHARTTPADLLTRAAGADVLLTNKTLIGAKELAQLPALKFIAVLATGHNVVDVVAARKRGIPVANVPAYGTDSVAQHVFALLLELANATGEHARSVAAGDWAASPDFSYWRRPVLELRGLRLGIVGFGRIGRRVAELGHAFGMKLLVAAHAGRNGEQRPRSDIFLGTGPLEGWPIPARHLPLGQFFAEADVVSLHCPQTKENFQFINRAVLRGMRPGAFLINTARGTLIHEGDLLHALQEGWIAGAALDVLATEPPPPDHPLFGAPRCVITPHVAWASGAARRRLMAVTAENVAAFIHGRPRNIVN